MRHERLAALLELVLEREYVHVDDIVQTLKVSPATARRDLDHLANEQLVVRTRGGAIPNPNSSSLPLRYRTSPKRDGVSRIAKAAAAMVEEGDVIGLNGGRTTTEIGREVALLPAPASSEYDNQIVVVTNAVNIANELAIRKSIRLVLTGGVVRAMSYELIGPLATRILDDILIDVLFLGVNSINRLGAFASHDGEAGVNAALVERSRKTVVVAEKKKLTAQAFAKICSVQQVHTLITEEGADESVLSDLRSAGIEIVLVD